MTVPTTTNKAIGTGNGVATVFPFTFGTLPSGDLVVTLFDLDGSAIPQIENTDYTVLGKGAEDGGSVVFVVPPPFDYTVLIQRILPLTQPDDLKNQGSYYPRTVERMFDRRAMVDQQLEETIGRTLTLPPQVQGVSTELPSPLPLNLIGWDATAEALRNFTVSDIGTTLAFSNFIADQFTATPGQTAFTLSADPGALANLDVSIDGVTQLPFADYAYLGTTLTFLSPMAGGEKVLARYGTALPTGITDTNAILYTPPSTGILGTMKSFLDSLWTAGVTTGGALIRFLQLGVGAIARTLQGKAQDRVSVRDFMTEAQIADTQLVTPLLDHTAALQAAFDAQSIPLLKDSTRLHMPFGHYRISAELVARFNGVLYGDGVECTTLTLLNATQNGIRVPYSGTLQIHGIHIKAGVVKSAGAGIKIEGLNASNASSQTRIFNCKVDQQFIGIDMANAGFWSIKDTIVSDCTVGIRSDNTQNFDGGDNIIGEGVVIYRTGSDVTAGTRGILHVGAGGLKVEGIKILGHEFGYYLVPRVGATYVVDTQIIGCSMEFQNDSIRLETNVGGTSIAQFVISGNQLAPRINGVRILGNAGGGVVTGNQIGVQFVNAAAIRLGTDGVNTPGNVNINGNEITGNGSAGSIGIHGGFAPIANNNAAFANLISGVSLDTAGLLCRQTDVTYTFANLPAAANGSIVYCSDGTIANPVAGGGTGCIAKRLNGVWVGN